MQIVIIVLGIVPFLYHSKQFFQTDVQRLTIPLGYGRTAHLDPLKVRTVVGCGEIKLLINVNLSEIIESETPQADNVPPFIV